MAVLGERLLLLGASVRAAAFSALRAGESVLTADLFADADLTAYCRTIKIDRYPAGFLPVAERSDCSGWLYTGGLENYPRLVERIAQRHLLWGNRGDVLRRVRDPADLADVIARHGLHYPTWQPNAAGLPTDGTWLRKGRRSSGGWQVAAFRGQPATEIRRRDYYQRRIAGTACAAVFVAAKGDAVLLGVSRQLLFGDGSDQDAFRYAGSIGPLTLDPLVQESIVRMGRVLAGEFRLVGLFGIDLIVDGLSVWLIEVNPRYPASVEILERASGVSAVQLHLAACREGRLPEAHSLLRPVGSSDCPLAGKLVVYAARGAQVTETMARALLDANPDAAPPIIADIPCAGTTITPGQPIATVLADGAHVSEVETLLGARRSWLESIVLGTRVRDGEA